MNQVTFSYFVEVLIGEDVFQEIELIVTGTYTPEERGTRGSFGEPLEPDYGPEFTIDRVVDTEGKEYTKEHLPDDWADMEAQGIEEVNERAYDYLFED